MIIKQEGEVDLTCCWLIIQQHATAEGASLFIAHEKRYI